MEGPFVILIADSSPRNRHVLRNYLEEELHYSVMEASTGPETLQVAQEKKPDLILLDSRIAELDGFEVARRLKSNVQTRMIRILLMAGLGEKDKRLYAIECGADEMLLKPAEKYEFLARVESFLRIKYFYDQLLFEREKVEKMKEDFLAMMTHDLKTPLTSIIGNVMLLMSHMERGDNIKDAEALRSIDIASRNLLFLVSNLLNVMRMESGMMTFVPEDFLFNRLAEEVVAMVRPIAERKKIAIEFDAGNNFWVRADMEKLRQVLSNLLSNAIKFTPSQGKVALRCSENEGEVVVEVSDTGPGLSEEDKGRLFKRFSQKRGEKGGTGLGLYIVKKMLELHGSDIKLKSEPGKGTTFIFPLQRVDPPKANSGR